MKEKTYVVLVSGFRSAGYTILKKGDKLPSNLVKSLKDSGNFDILITKKIIGCVGDAPAKEQAIIDFSNLSKDIEDLWKDKELHMGVYEGDKLIQSYKYSPQAIGYVVDRLKKIVAGVAGSLDGLVFKNALGSEISIKLVDCE